MIKKYWLGIFVFAVLLGWGVVYYLNTAAPDQLYKIISVENWKQSKIQDRLILPSMDHDFIHLSTKNQLDGIIRKFWKDESEFYVLTIDVKQLPGKLILETNPGGSSKYYHLYNGFLPISSVIFAEIVLK